MTSYSEDFDADIPTAEREALEQLAHRLVVERPLPSPAFRGELGRRLTASPTNWRRLQVHAAACLASGAALLLVAALGVADIGPLAPPRKGQLIAQISAR